MECRIYKVTATAMQGIISSYIMQLYKTLLHPLFHTYGSTIFKITNEELMIYQNKVKHINVQCLYHSRQHQSF
jgi:hypothetical protein